MKKKAKKSIPKAKLLVAKLGDQAASAESECPTNLSTGDSLQQDIVEPDRSRAENEEELGAEKNNNSKTNAEIASIVSGKEQSLLVIDVTEKCDSMQMETSQVGIEGNAAAGNEDDVGDDDDGVFDEETKDGPEGDGEQFKEHGEEQRKEASGKCGDEVIKENEEQNNVEGAEEEEEGQEQDAAADEYIHDMLPDMRKEREFEIFIGGLHKEAVEDDLIQVFGKFGEICSLRISKNPKTKKSKGFAFIQYATADQANKALSETKDGIEVKGKLVKISKSQGNNTLYVGNICKTWTKEQVLEKLKLFGIKQFEGIHLPEDPKADGKIRGFALLEFNYHSDAVAAFQRLKKADAILGCDRSAEVAFAQAPINSANENLSQVKTVYVKGLSDSWDEEKLKRVCGHYGDIEKVILSRDLRRKRNDFGFITFTNQESALACIDGLNNDQIGEVKVQAHIAKPPLKGMLQKQRVYGGFMVKKESSANAGPSQIDAETKNSSKKRKKKKTALKPSEATTATEKNSMAQRKPIQTGDTAVGTLSMSKKRKRKGLLLKPDGPRKQPKDHHHERKSSNRQSGKKRGKKNNGVSNQSIVSHSARGSTYRAGAAAYGHPYASVYDAPGTSYPALSGSNRRSSDMAPHAGYVEPFAGKQGGAKTVYSGPALGVQGHPYVSYVDSFGTQARVSYDITRNGQHGVDRWHPTYGGSAQSSAYAPSQAYSGYAGTTYAASPYYYAGASSGAYPPTR